MKIALQIGLLLIGLLTFRSALSEAPQAEGNLVSSNTGTSYFNGLSINDFVGATRFYTEGYNGSRSIVASIEAGHIWNLHETLSNVTQFFDASSTYQARGVGYGQLGQFDWHNTMVGQVIAGSGTSRYEIGISPGAELWSGAIATDYESLPFSNSWSWSRGYAMTDPYSMAMLHGVSGRVADVVTSSWGFLNATNASTKGGNSIWSVVADGLARQSRTTLLFAAGNEGPSSNTIRSPAAGYNSIAVGALGDDINGYKTIAGFSSRGPQDYIGPDGFVPKVRARVDIVAPGENLTLAYYGGSTGGNAGFDDPSYGATDWYWHNSAGTSFATPIVAGGAALLADVAHDRFAGAPYATDGEVIKAVLLNSADKPSSWNNGQRLYNGVVLTEQALDYTYGAGTLNLDRAFDQFTAGETDIAGLIGGTNLSGIGWDFGEISQGGENAYFFQDTFAAGSRFNVTLNWFVGRTWQGTQFDGTVLFSDDYFTNLRLEVWAVSNGYFTELIAVSDAAYLNTEHLSLSILEAGIYGVRVVWAGERYDFVGNDVQSYSLAWNNIHAVPEPATSLMLVLGLTIVAVRIETKPHRKQDTKEH